MNALGGTLFFILNLLVHMYSIALLIRFLLQLVQADFYNPLSQTVFKVCAPVVEPLSKIIPTVKTFNGAALAAALLVKWLFFVVVGLLGGGTVAHFLSYLGFATFQLLYALVEIYFWGIFILVISSWVGTTHHPIVQVVGQVMEPYLRPFRKVIPPIGMIDISPMVAILVLIIIRERLLPMLGGLIV